MVAIEAFTERLYRCNVSNVCFAYLYHGVLHNLGSKDYSEWLTMPSPFPGMDPYLEGYLWPDVHSALASKIRQQLTPLLRPKYIARLEVYLVDDPFPEGDMGIKNPRSGYDLSKISDKRLKVYQR